MEHLWIIIMYEMRDRNLDRDICFRSGFCHKFLPYGLFVSGMADPELLQRYSCIDDPKRKIYK